MSPTDPLHPGRPTGEGEPPPEWAMRTYVLGLLYRGPNQPTDDAERDELFRSHMSNSARMYEAGKLLIAGPLMDKTDLRGIWIFDSESIEECEKLVSGDRAVTAGMFRVEYHPWYSAKGITIKRPDVADIPPTTAR
ncbi:MAG TPA: YciI family protein [Candidatus Eisenbacteria bacterium]|nr:YciI family protein [Candidatus Eisenbacteria bacterium]